MKERDFYLLLEEETRSAFSRLKELGDEMERSRRKIYNAIFSDSSKDIDFSVRYDGTHNMWGLFYTEWELPLWFTLREDAEHAETVLRLWMMRKRLL